MHFTRKVVLVMAGALASAGCVVVGEPQGSAPPAESLPASAPPPTEGAVAQRVERDLFERLNDERVNRGLEPLTWDESLAAVAREWSQELEGMDRLQHQDLGEVARQESLSHLQGLGENLFSATGPVPAGAAHVGWMQSSGHRHNLLQPGFDRVGIGVHCGPGGATYATQQFGRTQGSDRPSIDEQVPAEQPIARDSEDGPSCSR